MDIAGNWRQAEDGLYVLGRNSPDDLTLEEFDSEDFKSWTLGWP
jgi:hypothetical protein